MGRFILFLGVILFVFQVKAQKVSFISDTTMIAYIDEGTHPLDARLVFILNDKEFMKERLVYKNNDTTELLYKSYYVDDTLTCVNYWSNGTVKKIETYNADSSHSEYNGQFYSKTFCENGQQINYTNWWETYQPQLITNYYCNGKVQSTFMWGAKFRYGIEGKFLWWYENGQLSKEHYYDDKGYKTGEWKYWKEDGILDKNEFYENDKLIKTTSPNRSFPETSEDYLSEGKRKIEEKEYEEALSDLNKSIELNSNNANSFYMRGKIKHILKKTQEAIKDYTKALSIDTIYRDVYYWRALAKEELGDKEGACKDMKQASSLGYGGALYHIGELCK